MGSWFSKKHDSSDDSDNEARPEEDLLKTDLGDQLAMSNLLNDQVLEYFQDKGYKINYKWDNSKMQAMLVLCILCAIAHAKLIPFPDDRYLSWVLFFIFFAMNTIGTLHLYFIERDIIVTAKAKKTNVPSLHIFIRASIPKYRDHYKISIEFDHATEKRKVGEDIHLGSLFDEEGNLYLPSLHKPLDALMKQFLKKKSN